MNNWDKKFDFENFSPTASQMKTLQLTFDKIMWNAPNDSNVKILVHKTDALFHVRCSVLSVNGQFAGQGISFGFNSALQLMECSINREINRWKKNRSFTETLDTPLENIDPSNSQRVG